MALIIVKNGESSSLPVGTVVGAQSTPVNMLNSSPLPAGAPISELVTKFPSGSMGRLRFTVGNPGSPLTLRIKGSDIYRSFLRFIEIPIAGAGVHLWPSSRKTLAYDLRQITGPAPGGSLSVDLLEIVGMVAGDGDTDVLGIVQSMAGANLVLVSAGPAVATCKGGWATNDRLTAAAGGALRKVTMGEAGMAVATNDQLDGATACPVVVDL